MNSNENQSKKVVNTEINSVTVYQNQALIIRKVNLDLIGTERELVIDSLPLSLQPDSVRTRGVGNVPVRILGIQTEKVFSLEPIQKEIAQLNEEIESLQKQEKQLNDRWETITLQRSFVQELGSKYLERFTGFNPPKQINLDEISNLLSFIGERDQSYGSEIANFQEAKNNINKQLSLLRKRLNQLQNNSYVNQYSHYRIIVTIEPENKGNFNLEISYLVDNASWNPLYDLRSNAKGDRLNLTYLAEVKQKTGEDWSNVSLMLSTAKPTQGKLPPKLEPLFVYRSSFNDYGRGGHHALAGRGITSSDVFDEIESLFQEELIPLTNSFTAEKAIEAEQVVATTSQAGGVVSFNLARNYSIPSDDQAHKVTIFNTDYGCQTQYITVPRIDCFAYLEANTINPKNGVTLLPGQANIFRDNTFIGKTKLENITPGQSFKINLGIDEGIKVTRALVNREIELIGNYRRITYYYRVEVSNLKEIETTLKVIEQLPVTRDEKIKVRLIRTNPEIPLGEMGKLEWSLILGVQNQSNSKQEIFYVSSTEYPTDLEIKYTF